MTDSKDELIKELADTLELMLDCEFGCGPDNVSENHVNQLIKKARGVQLEGKTEQHIKDIFYVDQG